MVLNARSEHIFVEQNALGLVFGIRLALQEPDGFRPNDQIPGFELFRRVGDLQRLADLRAKEPAVLCFLDL